MNRSYLEAYDVFCHRIAHGYIGLSKTSPFDRIEPVLDDPDEPLLTHRYILPWLDDYLAGKVSERDFHVFLYFLFALMDANRSAARFDYVTRVACLVAMKRHPVGDHDKKSYTAFAKCLKKELGRLLTERHKPAKKRRFNRDELEALTTVVLARPSPDDLSAEEKELYIAAIEKMVAFGSGWAANILGGNYYGFPDQPANEFGIKPDFRLAKKYYKLGAKLGFGPAALNLGYIYYYGRCGKPDYASAYKAFNEALIKGEAEAAYKLSDFYSSGKFVRKDKAMARHILVKYYPLVFSTVDYPTIGAFAYRLARLDSPTNYGALSNLFLGMKVYEQRAENHYNFGDVKVYKDLKADYEVKRIGASCVLNRPFVLPYLLSNEELCGCFGEYSPFWAQYRGSSRLRVLFKGKKGSQTGVLSISDRDGESSIYLPFLGADKLVKAHRVCFQLTLRERLEEDYDDYVDFDFRSSDLCLYLNRQPYHLDSALLLAYDGGLSDQGTAYDVSLSDPWLDKYAMPSRLKRWYHEAFDHEPVEQLTNLTYEGTQSYANSLGEFSFYTSFDDEGNFVFAFEFSSNVLNRRFTEYQFQDPNALEEFKQYCINHLGVLLDIGLPKRICYDLISEIEAKYRSLVRPSLLA